MSPPKVAIVTDDPGWHGRRLRQAFAERGYETRCVSLLDGHIYIESGRLPVTFPGFESSLPAGVFVRGVPGGTLEEIITYLNLLHILEKSGVKIYNPTRGIELSVDKGIASFLLHQEGIPTAPTCITGRRNQALAFADTIFLQGEWVVSKPLFGAQGEGIELHQSLDCLARLKPVGGVYYLQQYIRCDPVRDWRVFVIAGRAIAAMSRYGADWRTNVAQGGRCEKADLDSALCLLAEKSARTLLLDYAGVDILRDTKGNYWVLEANGIPAWKGLQSVTETDVTALLVDDFLRHCQLVSR